MFTRISTLIFLFMLVTISISAEEISRQKHYCLSEQIEINNSTILVHLDKNTIEVDTLLVDQGGVYFCDDAIRCFYCRQTLNPKNTCECLQ